jgi:hypothetical protein
MQGRMVSAHGAFRRCVELCRHDSLGRIEVANRPMMAFTQWFVGDTRGGLAEALGSVFKVGPAPRGGRQQNGSDPPKAANLERCHRREWPGSTAERPALWV